VSSLEDERRELKFLGLRRRQAAGAGTSCLASARRCQSKAFALGADLALRGWSSAQARMLSNTVACKRACAFDQPRIAHSRKE